MTAGLPGVGIGGIFYLASALLMPVRALVSQLRGERPRGGLALGKAAMAASMLGALWAGGWLLGRLLRAHAPAAVASATGTALPAANVVKVSALALSLGTLAVVLVAVQVARLVVVRPARARSDAAARRRSAA
jgi:hypothetical protein